MKFYQGISEEIHQNRQLSPVYSDSNGACWNEAVKASARVLTSVNEDPATKQDVSIWDRLRLASSRAWAGFRLVISLYQAG